MQIYRKAGICRANGRHGHVLLWGIILAVALLLACIELLHAQLNWPPERSIPEYNDPLPPLLLADRYGIVHAFNSEKLNDAGDTAIFYRQWSLADGWASPVDILLPPERGSIRVMDVFLDDNEIVHMVFFAGNLPDTGNIYYTHAPLTRVDDARGWAPPLLIGQRAGPLTEAAIVGDGSGNLIVVYAGRGEGIGLYEVHSTDSGQNWSSPTIVFLWQGKNQQPAHLWLTLADDGQVHAVWSVTNERALGEKIFYARLDEHMQSWSIPLLLAERTGDEYSADWPSIISHNGELFVVYMDSAPPTRYMRRSTDSGRTWTDPVRIFPQIGEYGQAVFLVDSNNTLHLVLGNRYPDPAIHGMWHSTWDGQRWRDPSPIVSGPKTANFDPSRPRAVISQGNVMLVTWWHDSTTALYPGYSFAVLDAPLIEAMPLATPVSGVATVTPEPTTPSPETVEYAPETVDTEMLPPLLNSQPEISRPDVVLFIGSLPVIFFVLAATLFTVIVRRHR